MAGSSLIPGFRFHPTDVELVMYYLKRKLLGKKFVVNAVAEVNIYDFGPWDLPDKSSLRNGDLEWFFFCPKSKKYSNGSRSNRATETGYWKATGKDRKVTYMGRTVATIKTLVFHLGHTGNGQRTDWVMHEYKMDDVQLADKGVIQDAFVLCKIFEKSGSGPKNGAQYGAPFFEEAWDDDLASCSGSQTVTVPNTVYPATISTGSLCINEPDLSTVTYSATTLNTCNKKLKDPVINVPLNEPGSSGLTCFVDENATDTPNNCDHKLKTRVSEPSSSSHTFSPNEACVGATPLNDDMMLFEDLVSFLGLPPEDLLDGNNENEGLKDAKSVALKEDEGIFDELVNFINLDELDGANDDAAAATSAAADINSDLRLFYVD